MLCSLGLDPSIMSVGQAMDELGVVVAGLEGEEMQAARARLLFSASKRTPSQVQQDNYHDHVYRAETDEDGFDD
jgi:hypothetical protein